MEAYMSFRSSNEVIIDSTSVVASENSATLDITNQHIWSFQVEHVSTTCSATLKVQESNDGDTWIDVSGASVTVNNDSADTMLKSGAGYQPTKYLRFAVVYSSGTLTSIKVIFNAK